MFCSLLCIWCTCVLVVFFFKQKTAYEMRISDWSSDVCSSDLTQSERVEIGDGERPGNYRARARPAARAHRNIIVLCPFDEVSNDEEITGKAHLNDDVE